jgi:exoribonuclease R
MPKILTMRFHIEPSKTVTTEVGVHIADVSHYMHQETLLEKEAYVSVQRRFIW